MPTERAKSWILERWNGLREVMAERPCVVDRAGLRMLKLKDLVGELEQARGGSIIDDAQIVLPASFGGIERGLLKSDADPGDSPTASDVADTGGRYRVLRTVNEDGAHEEAVAGNLPDDDCGLARFALDLPSAGDTRLQLISLVLKSQRPEFGTREQSLSDHVDLVSKYACDICGRLGLSDSDPIRKAVELAAAWHDRGKDREVWQCAAGHKPGSPPLGKSGGRMRRIPGNYRHEFGSLREFIDEHEAEIPDAVFDLAMHLIAVHHGRARPHFPKGGFDPSAPAMSPQIAADVIRRFARLQRKHGHWRLAWIEDLLRCADATASAGNHDK